MVLENYCCLVKEAQGREELYTGKNKCGRQIASKLAKKIQVIRKKKENM